MRRSRADGRTDDAVIADAIDRMIYMVALSALVGMAVGIIFSCH
jgi:hypothetical protein